MNGQRESQPRSADGNDFSRSDPLQNSHDMVIKAAESPGFLKRLFVSDDIHSAAQVPVPRL